MGNSTCTAPPLRGEHGPAGAHHGARVVEDFLPPHRIRLREIPRQRRAHGTDEPRQLARDGQLEDGAILGPNSYVIPGQRDLASVRQLPALQRAAAVVGQAQRPPAVVPRVQRRRRRAGDRVHFPSLDVRQLTRSLQR